MGSVKSSLFYVIDTFKAKHSVALLCYFAKVSRAGYYEWKNQQENKLTNDSLENHILAIHSIRPDYGYRRITIALKREVFRVNHKKVYRIMHKLKIQSVVHKKRRYFGKSGSNIFPNLLNINFSTSSFGHKLVTDINIPTITGFIYLSAVQDLYNNEIIAYNISSRAFPL